MTTTKFSLVLLLTVLLSNFSANAQLNMVRTIFNDTYTPITVAGGATATTTASSAYVRPNIPVGFMFNFQGNNYPFVSLVINGYIALQNPSSISSDKRVSNSYLFLPESPQYILAPYYDEIYHSSGLPVNILYQTQGVPGSRTFTAQWTDMRSSGFNTGSTNYINFQVILYEGTNVIEFRYGSSTVTTTSGLESASIGLKTIGGPGGYLDAVTGSDRCRNLVMDSGSKWPRHHFRFTPGTPAALPGGTYTVGMGQDFVTIEDAVAEINHRGIAGPVVFDLTDTLYDYTANGGWNQFPLVIGPVRGTSTVNTITFTSSVNPLLRGSGGTVTGYIGNEDTYIGDKDLEHLISIVGTRYLTLENFRLESAGSIDVGIMIVNTSYTNGAQYNTIRNVEVALTGTAGSVGIRTLLKNAIGQVASGTNSNNRILDVKVKKCDIGISVWATTAFNDTNIVIGSSSPSRYNEITECKVMGVQLNFMKNTSIHHTKVFGITSDDFTGISMINQTGVSRCYNNYVYNIHSPAWGVNTPLTGITATTAGTGSVLNIYNNFVYKLTSSYGSTGSTVRKLIGVNMTSSSGTTMNFDHNSIAIDGSLSPNISNTVLRVGPGAGTVNIRNNVIANYTGAQTGAGSHTLLSTNSMNGIRDNNIFYLASPSNGHMGSAPDNAGTTYTFAQLQAGGNNQSSQLINPQFVNYASDLHLSAASPLPGMGMSLPLITTDIDNDPRNTPPSIGADEYVLLPCTAADAGTVTASSTVFCEGLTAALNSAGTTAAGDITHQWLVSSAPGGPYANVSGGTGATGTAYTTPLLSAGTYYYVLETTCANGPLSDQSNEIAITVNANPVLSITAPAAVCYGQAASLSATGADTYTWTPGALTGASVSVSPPATTTYTVTGTATATGCTGTATATVIVNTLPPVSVSASSVSVCYPASVTLTGNGAVTYSWSPGGSSASPLTVTPAVTTTYTLTGTDANGCSNTSTTTITVKQPSSSTLNRSACSSYTLNGMTYTASGTYIQVRPNAAGCDSTITLNLTVSDVFAPVATVTVLPNVMAQCSVNSLTPPTATDNCAGTVTGTHDATLPIITQGTTVVTWTYNDGNGNTSTQTQNVVISDNNAPVANVTTLANVTGQCSVTSLTAPTATDNCAGTITGTTTTTLPIKAQGTTVVTWTYTDGHGNSSTQTQNVVINDNSAPVANLASLATITDQCSVTFLTAPTATDNCAGTITGTTATTFPITTSGTTVVTWTYNDGHGNTSTQTQNVVINDNSAPVANAASLANVVSLCSVTALVPPTATDNCAGTITGTTTTTLPITAQGTTIITWTYNDGHGNTSTQTQNVVINDNSAPVANAASLAHVTSQCSVTTLVPPTATDNCAGTITGTTATIFPITNQGTTIVTWTYNDGHGNTSAQTQNVVITDNTAPVATIAMLADVTSQCSITSLTAPTATDNCAGTITGTHNATLPITAQGTTVVTWTYNDGHGNTSTQTQNVVITDNSAPVANLASLANVTGQCSVTALTSPTATDNCAGTITGTTTTTLPITAQGTTIITWTYNDGHGNTSTQTQNVVITDNTAPVATIAMLADVTSQCSVASLTAPTATDNCVGTITGTTTTIFPITNQGTTIVTWTYNDGHGNTSTQTQNVVITDNTAPVATIAMLADVTSQCSVASLTAPTATDNCAGTITGTTTTTLPITTPGTTVVTWTYSDGHGNTSTQMQNVVITDNTTPVANLASLANVTDQCSVTSLTAPTATDNCAGTITGTTTTTLPITNQGTTIVTWTYNDGHGNTSTQTQNVVITDNSAPVATMAVLADVTGQCSITSLTAPTATDNCAGTITGTTTTTLPITTPGTTVVTWTYNDGHGNTSTQTQNVVITDNTAPVANLASLANVTSQCSVASLTAPTATDNCAGTITGTTTTILPITTQGTTVVTWTYDDGHGNISTQTQNVVITDNTAPVATIAMLADVTGQCSVTSLTAPTANDNCAGTITGTTSTTLPITAQGTTVITWTYSDGHGNTSTQTQNVVITDNTAPVANLASLANVTSQCSVTSLTAPIATDNCAGTITGTTTTTLPITTPGTTIVTWTYNDGHGNTSTQTQNVVISDNTAPVANLASLANVTDQCSVTSLTAPTATDDCAGTITGTTTTILPITTQGTTVVTWTYDDGHGNTSTQTQNVVIADNITPVATMAVLADVTDQCSVTSLTAPTANDNCAGTITGTTTTTLPITTLGTTVVTWTYDDGHGNTSTQTQNVVITDNSAPVATIAMLANVTGQCSVASLTPPTANDNCAGTITGTTTTTLPITTPGTTVVTWTYNDGHGNTSTQTQNVIVTVPVATTTVSGLTITATTSGATYQWINCGTGNTPIVGATAQTFTATANGTYAVIVTQNGCSSTSPCVTIATIGMEENDLSGSKLFPNPTSGFVTLTVEKELSNATVRLVSMTGQLVDQWQGINGGSFEMDLSDQVTGIYFIEVKEAGRILRLKVNKQ